MNKIIQWVLVVWMIGLTTYLVYVSQSKPSAYVNLNQVYKEFALTQELTEKYEFVKINRTSRLDSLEVEILKLDKSSDQYADFVNLYGAQQKAFSQEIDRLGLQYDDQIWKQINEYVEQFGSTSGYDLILGIKGEGNVMYGTQELNVTEEVLNYINRKYAGD